MGYQGSERTTRRAVAEAKRRWRQKHGRRTRPWIPEPGLWLQWDYGEGPVVAGSRTVLFCAWLAWSRYRVVVPFRDKALASVVIGMDRALRRFDGVPTYAFTDNEKTVTVEHVCGIAVRNPTIVEVSRHYGLTIATCEPADPQSHEGRSVIYVARQLGHDARLTLTRYGHVIDEPEDRPRIDAEAAIAEARLAGRAAASGVMQDLGF